MNHVKIFENFNSKGINVLIVSRRGILDNPILVKNDDTAQATFDSIAEELLGDDIDEINLHSDTQLEDLNHYLKYKGIEVLWYEDIEINDYKN